MSTGSQGTNGKLFPSKLGHPPPNWKLTDRPAFKTVVLTQKKYVDIVFAIFSAKALTFQGGPAKIGPETSFSVIFRIIGIGPDTWVVFS